MREDVTPKAGAKTRSRGQPAGVYGIGLVGLAVAAPGGDRRKDGRGRLAAGRERGSSEVPRHATKRLVGKLVSVRGSTWRPYGRWTADKLLPLRDALQPFLDQLTRVERPAPDNVAGAD